MKILVINAGSSSLKYQLIDMSDESVIAKGLCERIGIDGSVLTHKAHGKEFVFKENMPSHVKAIQMVLDALTGKDCGVVSSMKEIAAVGHRVVHGAEDYKSSVLIDEKVLDCCKENIELAPLHNPANIMGIEACRKVMPDTPMVAVFDTAFHATMPDVAFLYGLPYDDYKQLRIRKYGFHGTSHMFVSQEAAKYLGRENDENLKVITCHLGNGSSISAVKGGRSVETSMGFTPLEGVPMGTRCGQRGRRRYRIPDEQEKHEHFRNDKLPQQKIRYARSFGSEQRFQRSDGGQRFGQSEKQAGCRFVRLRRKEIYRSVRGGYERRGLHSFHRGRGRKYSLRKKACLRGTRIYGSGA